MKHLWSGYKSVLNIRKSSNINVINKLMGSNGNITSDSAVIVNIFNKFFASFSHDITKNLPRPNKSPLHFMGERISNSFYIAPSVPSDISDIISLLKSGKSLGPNSIPTKILKLISPLISSPHVRLCVHMGTLGSVPFRCKSESIWIRAHIRSM